MSTSQWVAERYYGDGYDPQCQWQPTLQGHSAWPSLPIWFRTRAECEQYIRDEVIGAALRAEPENDDPGSAL